MMKKILLLMVALFGMIGGGNVYATKVYATYGTPGGEGSWTANATTGGGSYSWTQSYSNLMPIFTFGNGELAQYKSLHLTTSGYTENHPYRVCFMNGSTAVATIAFYSAGQKNLVFAERTETKDIDLSKITHISFGGASGSGSITLDATPYLEKPFELAFDDNGNAEVSLTDLKAEGCLSLNDQTGVLTSTLGMDGAPTWGRLSINLPSEGVDLSALTGFEMAQSGTVLFGSFNIGSTTGSHDFYSNVTGRGDLAQYMSMVGDPSKVTSWRWNVSQGGTMTITSLKLKASMVTASNPHETLLTSAMFNDNYCENHFGEAMGQGSTIYGNGSVVAEKYADLSAYDELRIYGTPGQDVRLLFNWTSSAQKEVIQTLNESGYTIVDLANLAPQQLNAFKFKWDGKTATISKVICYKKTVDSSYDYILSGSGALAPSVAAALADPTATLIDATGVTASGLELTSANPNCIFVAGEGVLANEKNVMVGTTIARLVLTDGNNPYATPQVTGTVTATEATYSRTMPNKFGTLILPFSWKAPTGVKVYSMKEVKGDALVLEAYADDKVIAGSKPVIVEATAGAELTLTNNADNKQLAGVGAMTAGNVKMQGTYERLSFDVTADEENAYYAIANNKFTHATQTLSLNPFRAYITVPVPQGGSAPARLSLQPLTQGEATAIESLQGEGEGAAVEGIYGPDGVRRQGLEKGLNIVRRQDGKTVKVMVK